MVDQAVSPHRANADRLAHLLVFLPSSYLTILGFARAHPMALACAGPAADSP
jgi:hypothetical protein